MLRAGDFVEGGAENAAGSSPAGWYQSGWFGAYAAQPDGLPYAGEGAIVQPKLFLAGTENWTDYEVECAVLGNSAGETIGAD